MKQHSDILEYRTPKSDIPHVLLIAPPVYDFALYDLFVKPYGLLRIGRWLLENGYEVHFVNGLDYTDPATAFALGNVKRKADGTGKFFRVPVDKPAAIHAIERRFSRYGILPEVFRARIAEWEPDIVLVTSGMTYWYPGVIEAVDTVRHIYPKVPVLVGGIYASLLPEHCQRVTGAETLPGEAEFSLPPVLQKYHLPVPMTPFPYEPLLIPSVFSEGGVLRLNTGCPFSCSYCASNRIHPGFVAGSPDAAFDLVAAMHTNLGTKNFALYDDAFLVDAEKIAIPFLSRIAEELPGLSFYSPNALHISYIDHEIAALLLHAGYREVRLGYESSSLSFHESYDGKMLPEGITGVIETLTNAGFERNQIIAYILAGLPGQEAAEVEATIRTVSTFGIRISISEFSPVPGSPLWQTCVESSPYPLEEEPLCHNNSFFPLAWERFTRNDMARLKLLSQRMNDNLKT
ncbi:MAG TPA: radical SAM protein [Spirochaetia bacterium]|nr:radical SAM protein [Spirochaetia bacterium]